MDQTISLYRDAWGQLMMEQEGKHSHVFLKPCFPWSEPERHLSLRDKEGVELAVVENLNDLDEESREAANAELKQARFCFEITGIESVERDFELRVWKVRTSEGPRRFLTHLDTWPLKLPGGVLILRDLAGDLYRVSDPDKLDKKSGKLFWAFRD
ncbi:DUF1854 domain-containing protein [Rubellicoccus peritrichatus]|uniref:DUF1854 domain-containing protein n=1 Tax=Rubellicoccus peritrichatus TaxID=3080537 RepID=A0AAQ3LGF6_9BACT|nr:DUF1854 domain-containing protein [Puniceicoccus sp. CR14]WOO43363.1 DUF1854 domain-containing protein [Puniceicoccus sp. CR14]